jgi:hypothetical protein
MQISSHPFNSFPFNSRGTAAIAFLQLSFSGLPLMPGNVSSKPYVW